MSAKIKIILSGDWDEGKTQILREMSNVNIEFETVSTTEIRGSVRKKGFDAVLYAVKDSFPELDKRFEEISRQNEGFPFFVFSPESSASKIVDYVKRGITDYWVLPVKPEEIVSRIQREVHLYNLTSRIFMSGQDALNEYRFEDMIGRSRRMQDNFQMIAAVAKSNATVLITGESGTGKELVARAVHRLSERSQNRFVDINCGAIPRDLLENELFGHEKGSYTGAHKRYMGSFETAHQGTLFLDEISEMDFHLQVKLLRVLQERNFTRIGGNERINVDVRIIAATNRNLQQSIDQGDFREDLFYRLNVINIEIPSLRERREDIPLLAKHFLDYYAAKNNRITIDVAPEAMEALINYAWPGNVRELENTIERIVVLNDVTQIKLKHLPPLIQKVDRSIGYSDDVQPKGNDERLIVPLEDLERQAIQAALLKFHGNIGVVAKKLKIGQATLYRKVKKFGLSV